jgi:hypothetical protein
LKFCAKTKDVFSPEFNFFLALFFFTNYIYSTRVHLKKHIRGGRVPWQFHEINVQHSVSYYGAPGDNFSTEARAPVLPVRGKYRGFERKADPVLGYNIIVVPNQH